MTSDRRTKRSQQHRRCPVSTLRTVISALIALAVVGATASCTVGGDTPPTVPTGPTTAVPSVTPTTDGSASSSADEPAATTAPSAPGDAADIASAVDAALRALAENQDEVTRDDVRAAFASGFADAGAVPEAVEVSVDRTPTGLDVDAIQGAGRIAGDCIVGEVREGTVAVTVLPVLATGQCFVGDQR